KADLFRKRQVELFQPRSQLRTWSNQRHIQRRHVHARNDTRPDDAAVLRGSAWTCRVYRALGDCKDGPGAIRQSAGRARATVRQSLGAEDVAWQRLQCAADLNTPLR